MRNSLFKFLLVSWFAYPADLYFISPKNGEIINGDVKVVFGLSDFGVAPAGYNIPNTGHHHLIINEDLPDLSLPIPSNENYLHFGLGQTETSLNLEPGEYTLQLIMGNYLHIPHQEPIISKKISIIVE